MSTSAPTIERPTAAVSKPVSARRRFLRRFVRQRLAVAALVFLVVVATLAALGPWIAPHDPNAQDLANVLAAPSPQHLLGLDELGRDVVSRLLVGARNSLLAGLTATAVAVVVGVPVGLFAGFAGPRTDRVLMTLNNALLSLPGLVLAIAIVGIIGPGLTNAMIAIGVILAPRIIRILRGRVLELREETFIEASRSIGTGTGRILVTHVLPNVLSPLIILSSFMVGQAMLAEAGLSFLGLGIQLPEASWGSMLSSAFRTTAQAPMLIVYPGLAIAMTVLALNILGDGIRDSLGREVRR